MLSHLFNAEIEVELGKLYQTQRDFDKALISFRVAFLLMIRSYSHDSDEVVIIVLKLLGACIELDEIGEALEIGDYYLYDELP